MPCPPSLRAEVGITISSSLGLHNAKGAALLSPETPPDLTLITTSTNTADPPMITTRSIEKSSADRTLLFLGD
ncbi:hypothetical protein Pmani_015940 [Petrolisthes manimaculis]|uniref:Uncharacterized protein n=1 Tax=Petrolisthes manimaculis TaxID=1843537 RepID=A0AAE1PRC5_9EUCA|nr:hypothetical protein Pmani_015940 [Petrolisthes manimaculis]